ncbi:MAG: hypothetical protein A2X23_07835 [Chloroflexi bacterium GWC2_73_18]|nr:MAG: hypothetical protein A2X23_07835 [Chloroflexi bacterium GWC2_73_18]
MAAPPTSTDATVAIETRALTKRFGGILALDGLTMGVPRGETFGFLGPNGAGKTTAVKLLLGLVPPSGGEARLLGRSIGDRETRRRVGYLPEHFRYQGWLSGREVLALHCELAGLPRASWAAEIDRALAIVGLDGRGDDRVAGYSKGMQQRLGVAVALLGRPELVFLDEPTSALDPVGRAEMREIIRDLRAGGTTVFLNSHLLTEVEQVCDRVAIVDRGRVVVIGTLDALLAEGPVRVRVSGLGETELAALAAFGSIEREDDGLVVRGLDRERVPALVAELVRLGGRIFAVEVHHQTLEDRFRELVERHP